MCTGRSGISYSCFFRIGGSRRGRGSPTVGTNVVLSGSLSIPPLILIFGSYTSGTQAAPISSNMLAVETSQSEMGERCSACVGLLIFFVRTSSWLSSTSTPALATIGSCKTQECQSLHVMNIVPYFPHLYPQLSRIAIWFSEPDFV